MSILSDKSIPAVPRENARKYDRKTAISYNIAPQPIENELKLDKSISHAYVYGNRKPYLVALLTPNLERLIDIRALYHRNKNSGIVQPIN